MTTLKSGEKTPLQKITIPAGSIIHIHGIPFFVTNHTEVESHPNNIAMLSGPKPGEPV